MKGSWIGLSVLACLVGAIGCKSPSARAFPDPSTSDKKVARSQKSERAAEPSEPPRPPGRSEGQEAAVQILATVNGVPIFAQEVDTAAYQFLQASARLPEPERSEKQREIREKILSQLVEREIVLQEMESTLQKGNPRALTKLKNLAFKEFEKTWLRSMMKGNGYTDLEEFEEFLAGRGLPLPILQRQWVRNFLSREYLRSRVASKITKISRAELYDYYLDHAKEFEVKDEIDWQDIFISGNRYGSAAEAKQVAESLVERIRKGEDFQKLCTEFDDGDSALRDAAGIGRTRGEVRPTELEPQLFKMKPGEVGPVVPIGTGYHVFKLVNRQNAGRKPFDEDVQNQIRAKLRGGLASREMRQLVEDLRSRAVVNYPGN